ncbi:MAG: SET domain-containing protein [Candidatus Roizmanbacteria bacterium]|nr:SET domain-containing protein [Candidatus Roizmanbacteria bacterium]
MFLLPKDSLKIKRTKNKGYGVFARKNITAGTVISDYLGKIVSNADYDLSNDKQGLYLMYLSDYASIYPDLSKPGPHLVNHSCKPNCWIYVYESHTLFYAIEDITMGDELTISYLLSPDNGTCIACTHSCKCESINCTRTMHLTNEKYKMWQNYLNKKRKKIKKVKELYDSILPPLQLYPITLPIDPIYKKIYS